MNITIVNYTGISLSIKWDSEREIISCGAEKVIHIDRSPARLTRFYAKYKSSYDSLINTKGQINIIFNSNKTDHTLALGAFVDGQPKYIDCITANESNRYLYTEFDRQTIINKYPGIRFYNIPIELYYSDGLIQRAKKMYRTLFNSAHCENRDGPLCDKVVGIPVLILLCIIFIVIVMIVLGTMVYGWVELHNMK